MKSASSSFVARPFGKYALLARLAVGGMAEIFLARLQAAAGFEKLFVVKRILPHFANDPQFVARFLEEARIAADITHPNVCQVFELGEVDGRYFIAREYLEGVPLLEFLKPDAGLDPRLVAGLVLQAAEGLHHAHQLKRPDGSPAAVVHRDISPQSLFVTTDGMLKVLDFGLARAEDVSTRTRPGTIKGKVAYLAPEQLRGEPLDARTDVFALGIVAWELLAGRHLFQRDTDYLAFMAIMHERIPSVREVRSELPAGLAQALAIALSQDRDTRFHTARAFGEALARAVEPLGGALGTSALATELEQRFAEEIQGQRALVQVARQRALRPPTSDEDPTARDGAGDDEAAAPVTQVIARFSWPTWVIAAAMLLVGLAAGAGTVGVWWWARGAPAASASPAPTVVAVPIPAPAPPPVAAAARAAPGPVVPAPPLVVETPAAGAPARMAAPPPPKPGFLSIASEPIYAVIYVDGRRLGETPIVRQPLRPGLRIIKAVTPTGATKEFKVLIASGKEAPPQRLAWP